MKILSVFFLFCIFASLSADNFFMRMDFYTVPGKTAKLYKAETISKEPGVEKLISGKVLCCRDAESSVALLEKFEFREMGFSVKFTPESVQPKNFCRTALELFWQFSPEGPFQASGKESFEEGTNLSSRRMMRIGDPLPFGVSHVDKNKAFLPFFLLEQRNHTGLWEFNSRSEWKITLEIQKEGNPLISETCRPVYSKRKFPPVPVPGLECRMWNSSGITVMNLRSCREVGKRENGTPVLELLDLSLCFEAPSPQYPLVLAEITSFCSDTDCCFGKLPHSGGKSGTYRVLLQTK